MKKLLIIMTLLLSGHAGYAMDDDAINALFFGNSNNEDNPFNMLDNDPNGINAVQFMMSNPLTPEENITFGDNPIHNNAISQVNHNNNDSNHNNNDNDDDDNDDDDNDDDDNDDDKQPSSSVNPLLGQPVTNANNRYFCSTCNKSYSTRFNLSAHMKKHDEPGRFKCSDCDYRTDHKGDLTRHIMTHTGEKPFKCTMCDYATVKREPLKAHIKSKHPETLQVNNNNHNNNDNNNGSQKRTISQARADEDGNNVQNVVQKEAPTAAHMVKALMQKDETAINHDSDLDWLNEDPFQVYAIQDNNRDTNLLNTEYNHNNKVSDNHNDNASKKRTFSQLDGDNNMQGIVQQEPPIAYQAREQNVQVRINHNNNDDDDDNDDDDNEQPLGSGKPIPVQPATTNANNQHICRTCNKNYANERSLNAHMKKHSEGASFKCTHDGCTHASFSRDDLKKHQMTHTGERPFKCKVCGYGTVNSQRLKQHISSKHPETLQVNHNNNDDDNDDDNDDEPVPKHVCDQCGETYATTDELKMHMKKHAIKNFKCPHAGCPYVVSSHEDLRRHVMTEHRNTIPLTNNTQPIFVAAPIAPQNLESGMRGGVIHQLHANHNNQIPEVEYNNNDHNNNDKEQDKQAPATGSAIANNQYLCPICKVYCKKAEEFAHIKSHVWSRKHCCSYKPCKYKARDMETLTRHLKKHTATEGLLCPHAGCTYRAKSEGAITSHIRNDHDASAAESNHNNQQEEK